MVVDDVVEVNGIGTATSVVVSTDEVLCSNDVGASSEGETVAGVGSGLCVRLAAVVVVMIVVDSGDEVLCRIDVRATCVLVSASIVGCAEVDVTWTRVDAVSRMMTAAASASSMS